MEIPQSWDDANGTAHLTAPPPATTLADALVMLRRAILEALDGVFEPGWCLSLYGLKARTDLPRETLRGIIADMRAEGLVSYHKGLWSDDGMPAGAGYAITEAGRAVLTGGA